MLALRWSMRFIGLFSTIILARLLTPQDFGLVAMALVVLAIADSATSLGVDLALIRHEGDATHLYNAAWTLRILQNLGLAILLLIAAPFAVDYFHESRLEGIFRIYALRYVLLGFANIGPVEFRKNLEFSREYRFLLTKKFVGFFLTVGLAIWLRDYRAIVYATLAKTIFGVCYSYVIHPYRPRLSTSGMKSILGFSQWVLVARLGGTLNEKGAQLIAGAAVSASTLGLYHISVELATMFINEVVMPARRSLIPNLSKSLGNRQQFIHHSIISLSILGIVCIPIGVGVNIVALELVELLFGPRWVDAVPLVELLALLGIFLGTKLALTMILLVAGDAKKNAVLDWLEVLILIPLLTYVGSSGDIE
ncbi:MAG: lipopolysaccharide biosynthesis protein, partial [Gammaproteobacteria bacterium]